ncbi:hypothetical protein PR048_002784 [Dryococelus australis]|uniref:Uncharacterized protein n=1 Tax=Dryococelus australis TaxID=614101 RepID=A0ABQ9IL68_9NEOP|nr:hypothetical protein PR048_002784 [Dryococelus australis]
MRVKRGAYEAAPESQPAATVQHESHPGARIIWEMSGVSEHEVLHLIASPKYLHADHLGQWNTDIKAVFHTSTSVGKNNQDPRNYSADTKSKYRNRIRLERASQKQSSYTHKTPHDRAKRCLERKINIKASERAKVDVSTQNKRPPHPVRLQGKEIFQGDMHRGSKGLGCHGLDLAMTTSLSVLIAKLFVIDEKLLSLCSPLSPRKISNHHSKTSALHTHFWHIVGTQEGMPEKCGGEAKAEEKETFPRNTPNHQRTTSKGVRHKTLRIGCVKHVYIEVTFSIRSQFIRHALDDSEPIAELQGKQVARAILPGLWSLASRSLKSRNFPISNYPEPERADSKTPVAGKFRYSPWLLTASKLYRLEHMEDYVLAEKQFNVGTRGLVALSLRDRSTSSSVYNLHILCCYEQPQPQQQQQNLTTSEKKRACRERSRH